MRPFALRRHVVPDAETVTVPDEVQLIVDALDDKRAKDVTVLDLTAVSESLDWFVVATGESSLQLKSLEDGVRERLKAAGHVPRAVEGPSTRWVLVDYGWVVVHIMSPEAREFYDIEGLWADAARVAVTPR
jgi:ribosome-associated protein